MQTTWRRIFQRGVSDTGLHNQPAIAYYQVFVTSSILKHCFHFFFFFSVCLLDRRTFLTSGHRDRFSDGFCCHRITPICGKILIHWAENLVNNPHHHRKEDRLVVHALYKAKFSAEADGASVYRLYWIGEYDLFIPTTYKQQHYYCSRSMWENVFSTAPHCPEKLTSRNENISSWSSLKYL